MLRDVTLRRVCGSGTACSLTMKALCSFEPLRTTKLMARRHIPEDLPTSSVVIRFRPAGTLAYFVILIVEAWNCSQMGQGMPLSLPFRPNNCMYGPIIMCAGM